MLSCSSDDSQTVVTFSPPEWLIGTWNHENPEAVLQTYVVSENNVTLIYPNGNQLDYSEHINNNSSKSLVENEITDTRYSYTINDENLSDFEEDYYVVFEKNSDTEIELFINVAGFTQTYFRE